jgi:hypothetical protein
MRIIAGFLILSVFIISCKISLKSTDENCNVYQAMPPTMGWASWNNYRVNISEDIIKSQADAMIKLGLDKLGYNFINIDDGFFGGRDSCGNILVHRERFPNGMKGVVDYIHSLNLKAGIYSDAGINTCASYWDKDTIGAGMGLWGHEEQDLTLFLKEWDFDFLKVDWCGADWMGLDEETRYTEIGEIAREVKPSVVYNVCRWQFPGKWITGVADSWRISGDIGNNFESVLHIIDQNADLWMYCSKGHYNDMDMLQVGRGMTYEEDKTHFSMWCMMQSPLILGNDLTKMSEQTLEIISNKDMIALNQGPFAYQARRLFDYGDLEVWGKPLISTMSGKVAVALLNRSTESQVIHFNVDSVGIDSSHGYAIKDLWTKEIFENAFDKTVSRTVEPHGIVVLEINGKSLPYNVYQYSKENYTLSKAF